MSNSATKPDNLGVNNGKLAACPESANCVSSQVDSSDPHYIAPLAFIENSKDKTREKIIAALKEMPRTEISSQSENYIQAQCSSLVFRFVDDLEIVFDDEAGVVHFRSASRTGKSDLGVNRRRLEKLKAAAGM